MNCNLIILTILLVKIDNSVELSDLTSNFVNRSDLDAAPSTNSTFRRPKRLSDNFVINGIPVRDGGAPHQVALELDESFTCGGSWIQARTVLTAAHCVFDGNNMQYKETRLRVRYNTLDRTKGTLASVSKVIPHPEFKMPIPDYDIAILHLAKDIKESKNAKIISLISHKVDDGSSVQITGWGLFQLRQNKASEQLLSAQLTLKSRTECNQYWKGYYTDRMLCAGRSTQSACKGDSGGPLTYGDWLIGVASFVYDDCDPATLVPNVFTDVNYFHEWIKDNMHKEATSAFVTALELVLVPIVLTILYVIICL